MLGNNYSHYNYEQLFFTWHVMDPYGCGDIGQNDLKSVATIIFLRRRFGPYVKAYWLYQFCRALRKKK